jgi:uncharacterized protein YjcR
MRKKRRPGGQPGNQNARKHGFYSKVLTQEQQADLPATMAVRKLDEEIAVARMKLKSILANDPQNYELQFRALSMLTRLVNMKHSLNRRGRGLSLTASEALLQFASCLTSQNDPRSK